MNDDEEMCEVVHKISGVIDITDESTIKYINATKNTIATFVF